MSDGQFSSKPMRSGRSRDMAITVGLSAGDQSADSTTAFLQSAAVQREVNALMDRPMPPLGELYCAPLHRKTPARATDLGRPVASATLVQEYLIGLIFLRFWGWVFLLFGTFIVLAAIFIMMKSVAGQNAPGDSFASAVLGAGFGLFIGGAGVWFGIVRGRVITEMCWLFLRGMIWMTDGHFDWYTWEEVPELYSKLRATRPAIGIRFEGDDVSWISFSNSNASRLTLAYIEKRASAACLPAVVRLIAQGSVVRFGGWNLSRTSLRDPDGEFAWHEVFDVDGDDREICIRHRDRGNLIIPLDEVPFPSLFAALVRGIYAYSRAKSA